MGSCSSGVKGDDISEIVGGHEILQKCMGWGWGWGEVRALDEYVRRDLRMYR